MTTPEPTPTDQLGFVSPVERIEIDRARRWRQFLSETPQPNTYWRVIHEGQSNREEGMIYDDLHNCIVRVIGSTPMTMIRHRVHVVVWDKSSGVWVRETAPAHRTSIPASGTMGFRWVACSKPNAK